MTPAGIFPVGVFACGEMWLWDWANGWLDPVVAAKKRGLSRWISGGDERGIETFGTGIA